jgi:hypothetical protein
MALIASIEENSKGRQAIHKPTRCLFTIVELEGRRLLQLDTYGSDERQFPNKVSQSLQSDESTAKQLMELIQATFPSLREKQPVG